MGTSLPIWQIHPDVIGALRSGNRLVLVAPTGSGKTTQIPQMLLDAGRAGDRKIVVLQPRRVAARTVAARVAWERKCPLGGEVGYQIRFEDRTSLGTRICYVTEGVLLRWLQDDRTLSDVSVLLFDEFHERNLLSDVALALAKELQRTLRPDLKIAVMSATLDAEPVAHYLGSDEGDDSAPSHSQSDKSALGSTGYQPVPSGNLPDGTGAASRNNPGAGFGATQPAIPVGRLPTGAGRLPAPPFFGTSAQDCPILISEGQSFPVAVRYLEQRDERPATEQAADAVERIVNSGEPGDVLVFMPGMGEINATINALQAARTNERLAFIPLHGELAPEDQDRAFAPNPLRKVVVATNVAETSVTIDGIRHVVDSGLARIAHYDAERGLSTLFVEEISRASADQRKGRAGRTAPGTCYRLWTESGQLNRPERNTPEIQRADLAEVVLLLHSLGIKKAVEFDWLDKPDPQAVERAEKLLRTLGALRSGHDSKIAHRDHEPVSEVGRVTPCAPLPVAPGPGARGATRPAFRFTGNATESRAEDESDLTSAGRQMLRLPMHPRYSRMLVEASKRDCVPAAALCAALVSGRDMLMRLRREDKQISEARELFEASQESDFFTLIRAFRFAQRSGFSVEQCRRYGIHAQTARQVEQTFEQILALAHQQGLAKRTSRGGAAATEPKTNQNEDGGSRMEDSESGRRVAESAGSDDALLRCLMAGFIDQLCVRHDLGTLECDLTEGRHGTLVRESVVQNAKLFVTATIREVEGRGSENLTLLGLASAVKLEWIVEMFPEHVTHRIEHLFDRTHKRVAAVKLVRFQDLVIQHEHQRDLDGAASGRCLAEAYRKGWFELPLFNHAVKQFIARVNLVTAVMPELEFPAFDDEAITSCLARAFHGLSLVKEAQGTHVKESFVNHLAAEQAGWLEELAPLSVVWPDGRKLKLLYPDSARAENGEPNPPDLQVKLHECFALREHPRLCEGRLPVRLWLCAPDGKRLEATNDWPAFKAVGYPKLKPVLQKKYPGMAWH